MYKTNKYIKYIIKYLTIYFLIFYLLPASLFASPTVTLTDNIVVYDDFQVDLLMEKPHENLGIEKIAKLPFLEQTSNTFSFGYKENNFWFHFSVYNDSETKRNMVLGLTEIIHHTVDLYVKSNEQFIYKENGLKVPVDAREIKESNPAFNLHFQAHETKEIYVNIATIYGLFGSLKLKTDTQFYEDLQFKKYMYLIYLSAIIIIGLYNLVIFFYLREKVYLYYIGYVFVFVLWAANYKGVLLSHINMYVYDILQITIPIFFTLLILFSQAILSTKKYFPVLHKILIGFLFILGISLIWMLISMHSGFYFMNLCASPLLPFLLFVATWALYKGHKIAKLYMIGLSIYIISMFLISQMALGVLPYNILLSHAPIIGSFFEIMLFSLLLSYRINLLRQDKLETQEKLYENEHNEAVRLSQMVESQTSSLLAAKKILEKELEERKILEKDLQLQASTDSMTGIMNRRSFFERCSNILGQAIRYERELSLFILDLDNFKNVNEKYGHLGGDEVLIKVVNRIKNSIRDTDVLGRIGGEEFALLMPETDLKSAQLLSERVRNDIEEMSIDMGSEILYVTASIGVDTLKEEDTTIQTILRRSDLALFRAKENGRNQTCC